MSALGGGAVGRFQINNDASCVSTSQTRSTMEIAHGSAKSLSPRIRASQVSSAAQTHTGMVPFSLTQVVWL